MENSVAPSLDEAHNELRSQFPLNYSTTPNISTESYLIYTSNDIWVQNEIYAYHMIPVMVFVAALMIVGIPGNCLAVYVYGFRFKPATQNVLIVYLGVMDLIMCVVAMPMEIIDLRFHHTFDSVIACKILRSLPQCISITSCFTLISVACDRHKRITQPLSRQMTPRRAKVWAALNLLGSVCISWPSFILSGLKSTETNVPGLYGKDCSISQEFINTVYPLIFNGVMLIAFFTATTIISALYFRIWKCAKARMFTFAKRYTTHSLTDASPNRGNVGTTAKTCPQRNILQAHHKRWSFDNNITFTRGHVGKIDIISENGDTSFTSMSVSRSVSGQTRSDARYDQARSKYQRVMTPKRSRSFCLLRDIQSLHSCVSKTEDDQHLQTNGSTMNCSKLQILESLRRSCPNISISNDVAKEIKYSTGGVSEKRNVTSLRMNTNCHSDLGNVVTPCRPESSKNESSNVFNCKHYERDNVVSQFSRGQIKDPRACTKMTYDTAIDPAFSRIKDRAVFKDNFSCSVLADDAVETKTSQHEDLSIDAERISLASCASQGRTILSVNYDGKDRMASLDWMELDTPNLSTINLFGDSPCYLNKANDASGFKACHKRTRSLQDITDKRYQTNVGTRPRSSTLKSRISSSTPAKKGNFRCGGLDKTTVVALAVSCLFVFSFLPHLAASAVRGFWKNLYDISDWTSLCVHQMFIRFFFFNSVSNPIIYGVLNPNFRQECRAVWRRLICCFCAKMRGTQL